LLNSIQKDDKDSRFFVGMEMEPIREVLIQNSCRQIFTF